MPSKYSVPQTNPTKTCQARASDIRVHFKHMREVAAALRTLPLRKAQRYLRDVLRHRQAVPFRKFNGGIGRTSQANVHKYTLARWPQKAVNVFLDLLKNAQSNAETKGLDVDKLSITHVQVNAARQGRRRTYRAHGRINPAMSNPSHVEVVLTEREAPVPKPAEEKPATTKAVAKK